MIDPERTIAAQATAAGQGAIAVIRMSGPGCMAVLKQCTPAALSLIHISEPTRPY